MQTPACSWKNTGEHARAGEFAQRCGPGYRAVFPAKFVRLENGHAIDRSTPVWVIRQIGHRSSVRSPPSVSSPGGGGGGGGRGGGGALAIVTAGEDRRQQPHVNSTIRWRRAKRTEARGVSPPRLFNLLCFNFGGAMFSTQAVRSGARRTVGKWPAVPARLHERAGLPSPRFLCSRLSVTSLP